MERTQTQRNKRNKRPNLEPGRLVLQAAALLAFGGIVLLFALVVVFALPVLAQSGDNHTFSWIWNPGQGFFGILPMLTGSLLLGLSALLVSWPLAFVLTCWLLCPEPGKRGTWPRTLLQGLVRLMTAVPTVVYGFAALFLLAPFLRMGLGGSGLGWLTAALMLALLVLPTVVLVLQAGLAPRLEAVSLSGQALGFSRLELLWTLVLPHSRSTLAASAILGLGRALGDTMLPLMLAGNAPGVPDSLLSGLRTLTAHMALVTANEVGGAAYDSLFAAGLFLLLVNACVSLVVRRLEARS